MKYLVIIPILISFLGFSFNMQESNALIDQENKSLIHDNGLYTKNGLPAEMIELGKDAQIVFPITESMTGNATKAVVRYQIVSNQYTPFDTTNFTEFNLDSMSSEISFSFASQEHGLYFLQQEISYREDDDTVWGTSSSTRQFIVVDKFSKAVGEDGLCKTSAMISMFKPNFSKNICVKSETYGKLASRWY